MSDANTATQQSRVIKFRAFYVDGVRGKQVRQVKKINFPKTKSPMAELEGGGSVRAEVLMQFTGLLDKNGREIYEGDILMEGASAGYIHWNTVGAYYQLIEAGSNGCPSFEIFDGRTPNLGIIGNIYENPGLLKAAA